MLYPGVPMGTFEPSVGTAPGLTSASGELAYWQDRAALLDPNAYVMVPSTRTDTVPAGETWYATSWFQQQTTAASSTANGAQGAAPAAVTTGTTAIVAAGATSIPVTSTTGFAASGIAILTSGSPTKFWGAFSYTSVDATHFLGVTGISGNAQMPSGVTVSQGSGTLVLASTTGFAANGPVSFPGGAVGYYTGTSGGTTLTGCVSTPAVSNGDVVSQLAYFYQRNSDARNGALALPAGTAVSAAYYCRPSLVTADSRYATDPKGLYYTRLDYLRKNAFADCAIYAPAGTAMGTTLTQNFPALTNGGIIVAASLFDMSWIGLRTPTGGTLNINNEVSDDHVQRFGQAMLLPFLTTTFSAMKARVANPLGLFDTSVVNDGASMGGQGNPLAGGYAVIRYVALPAGW